MGYTLLIVTMSLIVQLVTLLIVIYSYILKRKMKFIEHGSWMLVAVAMQIVSLMIIMGPSLFIILESGFVQRPILLSTVTFVHASLGQHSVSDRYLDNRFLAFSDFNRKLHQKKKNNAVLNDYVDSRCNLWNRPLRADILNHIIFLSGTLFVLYF